MEWVSTPTYQLWGVVTGIAFAVMMYPIARKAGIGFWDYWKIGIVACVTLYLGARLFWEIAEFPLMPGRMWVTQPQPLYARLLRPLGFTYLGALAGLAAGEFALGLTPLVKPGPGRILDVLAPVSAFSFALSKIGCLMAGCCYGATTSSFFSVTTSTIHSDDPVTMIPIRYMEMGFAFLLGAVTLWLLVKPPASLRLRDGVIFAGTFTLMALARLVSGFFRGDYEIQAGALDVVQWGALAMVAAGTTAMALLLMKGRRPADVEKS